MTKCEELGVDIRLNCYAKKILKDANDWCSGVWVEQNGISFEIPATVIVMATGGFLGENRLMEQFCPYYDEVFFDEVGHSGNLYSGNGVDMAIKAGAGDEGICTFVYTDEKMPFYKGELTPCLNAVIHDASALVVNNVGIRFSLLMRLVRPLLQPITISQTRTSSGSTPWIRLKLWKKNIRMWSMLRSFWRISSL